LAPEENHAVISDYARSHPLAFRVFARVFGYPLDGTEAARREFSYSLRLAAFHPRKSAPLPRGALSILSPEEVYKANHHEDYVMEMPQSGESVRGRENMRKFHVRLTQRATAALKEHRKRQVRGEDRAGRPLARAGPRLPLRRRAT
jgi:hypothetical protein